MHHVAAGYLSVVVHYQCTLLTLADRANHTLWHTLRVVGISKLVQCLLLLIVAYHTLVGDSSPQVLVLVYIYYRWNGLDTESCEGLFHVALKALSLRMIDAVALSSLDEQVSVECLLYRVDIAVAKRTTVLRVALEVAECVSVESVQSCRRTKPHISARVFQYAVHLARCQSVASFECFKQVVGCHCHRQCQHQKDQ